MTRKVLAETNFDHTVQLIQVDVPGFIGSNVTISCYYVTYGAQTHDCGTDFDSAWGEFKACTEHAMRCAGMLDSDDDEDCDN